jgi:hypothetical protein
VNDLVLVFLLVSCVSFVLQVLAFIRLVARRAHTATEELVSGGYLRTVACRILAATTYVVVAAIQLAGDGTLTFEALVVWIGLQILWLLNSLGDIRIRRSLSPTERPRHALR